MTIDQVKKNSTVELDGKTSSKHFAHKFKETKKKAMRVCLPRYIREFLFFPLLNICFIKF